MKRSQKFLVILVSIVLILLCIGTWLALELHCCSTYQVKTQSKIQLPLSSQDQISKSKNANLVQNTEPTSVKPTNNNAAAPIIPLTALEDIDNTKRGWGIKLNTIHQPPQISSATKSLFNKYDAFYLGDTSQKKLYLTFDAGYENNYTNKILDTLRDNNTKTIFFMTGSYIDKNPDLVKRIIAEGHLIGNHTLNHPSLPTVSLETAKREIDGVNSKIYSKFGIKLKYFRMPNGEYSSRMLALTKQMGYKSIFWSFAYKDYDVNDQKGADYAFNVITSNTHNGAVMLLHVVSKDNADALDRVIKNIKDQGYTLAQLDV